MPPLSRVLLKFEGLEAGGGVQRTLGTALLPLHDAAVAALAAPEASAAFSIPVLKYGIPTGVPHPPLEPPAPRAARILPQCCANAAFLLHCCCRYRMPC